MPVLKRARSLILQIKESWNIEISMENMELKNYSQAELIVCTIPVWIKERNLLQINFIPILFESCWVTALSW